MCSPQVLGRRKKRRLQEGLGNYIPEVQLKSNGQCGGPWVSNVTFDRMMDLREKGFDIIDLWTKIKLIGG